MSPDHVRGESILKARAWIDGGARGNPGPAGWGARIVREDGQELRICGFLGSATNNVAEYAALIEALEAAVEDGVRELTIFSDSQLLVRQMNGQYKVKHPNLIPLFLRARRAGSKLESLRIDHVRREQNREADALANQAMDNRVEREVERIAGG